eukprot:264904-Pelagomonas_calceolata.AAC.2
MLQKGVGCISTQQEGIACTSMLQKGVGCTSTQQEGVACASMQQVNFCEKQDCVNAISCTQCWLAMHAAAQRY